MRELTPQELEPGMIVAMAVTTPSGQILAGPGDEVTRQLINRMKLYRVATALVNDPSAPAEEPQQIRTVAEELKTAKQKVAESQEFKDFQMQYFVALRHLREVFTAVAEEAAPIDVPALLKTISELFLSRNTIIELFDMLNNTRAMSDSVYAHCINVSLTSRMIGRWLRLDPHDLDVLTLAGLLHDIGKVKIPEEILNKPGNLTPEEFAVIKTHPQLGYKMLKSQNLDSRIKNAALMHHERSDGSGYPHGINEELTDEFAMIVAIADVYDAMTASRSYRSPLCAFQVISNFEKDGFRKYNTKYLLTFLKQIAATYQNNRVILNDGRGCNIVMLNSNDLSRPMVQFDDNSCLDLSTNRNLYITAVV